MFAIVSTKNAPSLGGIRRFISLMRGYALTRQSHNGKDFFICELYGNKNERRNIRACARLFAKLKSLCCNKCVFERDFKFIDLANQLGINQITANSIYRLLIADIIDSICVNSADITVCIFSDCPESLPSLKCISQNVSEIHIITDAPAPISSDPRIKYLSTAQSTCHIAVIYSANELLTGATVKENGVILNFSSYTLPSTLSKSRIVANNVAFRFGKDLITKLPSGNFNHGEIAQAFFDTDKKSDISAVGFWSDGRYIGFRTAIRLLSHKDH